MAKTTNILDLNNRLEKVEKENVEQNNYNSLQNRPKINGNLLTGNKTGTQLGLINSEAMEVKTSTVERVADYSTGGDWDLTKQFNICILHIKDVKNLPAAATIVGTIPEGYRPNSLIYARVYDADHDTHIRFSINTNGDIVAAPVSGAITGSIYANCTFTYFIP